MKEKRTKLLLLLGFLFYVYGSLAQGQQVSMDYKNEPLSNVFKRIEKASGVKIQFAYSTIANYKVSGHIHKKSALEAVQQVIEGFPLTFSVKGDGKYIVITPTREKAKTQSDSDQKQSKEQVMLYGIVMDETNMPLQGVTVAIANNGPTALTNARGEFSIPVEKGVNLIFSSVGFDKKEVVYLEKNNIKVFMSPSANKIEDVIVTGIFDRPKESFTGAVTTVSAEELKRFAPQNPLMALQLLDPSFQMPPNLEAGGNPNVLPEIRLRGQNNFPIQQGRTNATLTALYGDNPNAPLFIMDGFEIPLQTLIDMDMNRIARISILKDASATAIYGSRGSNGVVVIETIRPKPGTIQIGYTGNIGFAIPDLSSYNLMTAREKYELERIAGLYNVRNTGASVPYQLTNQAIIDNIYSEVVRGVDTYWLSQPLQTAISQSHTLNIMGGDQAFRYSLIGGYKTTPGVMIGNSRRSLNGAINLQYVTKKLTVGNNLEHYSTRGTESPYGSFSRFTRLNPFLTPYDANGNLVRFLGDFKNTWGSEQFRLDALTPFHYRQENPLYAASLDPVKYDTDSRWINNTQIRWNVTSNFFLSGRFSYTISNRESHDFSPSSLPRFDGLPFGQRGQYSLNLLKSDLWDADVQGNFTQQFGKHLFFLSASGYLRSNNDIGYFQQATGFSNENMRNFIFASQYAPGFRPQGSQATVRQATLRGNANYSYDNRYLVDFSYSTDGSSQFGANRRYNTFWSLGARWNLHQEHFLKDNPAINRLQIRGSIGPTGGQNFPPYQGITTFVYDIGNPYHGLLSSNVANYGDPNLQWQSTFKQNLGLDMTFFRDRVNITVDVFKDKVTNMLMEISRPPSVGFDRYSTNLGGMENSGWELSTNVAIVRNLQRNITWNIGFNTMQLRNKITSLTQIPGVTVPIDNRGIPNPQNRVQELQVRNNSRYVVGGSMDDIWAIPSGGIDPVTGYELFIMPNGEYTYSASNAFEQPLGTAQPKFLGSFMTNFQYKDWTFSAAASYRTGARVFNVNLRDRIEFTDVLPLYQNLDRRVATDRWINPGDVKPFLDLRSRPVYRASSRFLQTERMLQMQSISLAYRIPNAVTWLKRLRMSNTMLSLYWNTPFVITSLESEQRGLNTPFQRSFSLQLSTTLF
ncbi:SusC/RagA family TonB-linked outer membrane protein [Sphingobacterium griseoflavum]|uniref:SusC/RagA family TonB-linked outer membrane protein n=1 Tax=Sphingobacterium griseoflavum TaxID=1474952 RepID=A0ABQ3I3W7_9SPHI|nr:SusC/RagA family TonB-linked outer membrane protein [Sphingobacterium griseoflavum]GHE48100.1 SusC/RagA family TonB-linked outer membrane protein [Sphingobacterium griseoflavum]